MRDASDAKQSFPGGALFRSVGKTYGFSNSTRRKRPPPKATVSKPFWARKRRHAHDVGKNRVVKMCSLRGRGAQFHKFSKKSKKKRGKRHRKRNQHKKFKEMAKMKSQI